MATLKDIAKEAGVSIVTVSNVINGNHKKVSDETIARIQKIIHDYHYVPNATARSLASKQSGIIGVLVPNVGEDENFLQSPYNAEVLGVLEKIIRQSGYYLMVRCLSDYQQALPLLHSWNVDGAVFIGANTSDVERLNQQLSIPAVFLDTYTSEQVCGVCADDFRGGYIGTRYLINQGHTHICFLAPGAGKEGVIYERFRGYRQAMEECGLQSSMEKREVASTTYESGLAAGRQLAFEQGTTACVTTADILAIGLMEGLRLSGRRVPEDFSIVGFDDLPECRYTTPQLTTINQHVAEKAEKAAGKLLDMLRHQDVAIQNERIDVDLVERQSVQRMD
ncbi:MAG: LacI family transcriptional regulator [Faecalibacterium sp.]|jgi:LacI family transcriptional regulator|nr:LacI family transcriptional regulator [Faecalibacterium sp.]